jgi:hypothetical protein
LSAVVDDDHWFQGVQAYFDRVVKARCRRDAARSQRSSTERYNSSGERRDRNRKRSDGGGVSARRMDLSFAAGVASCRRTRRGVRGPGEPRTIVACRFTNRMTRTLGRRLAQQPPKTVRSRLTEGAGSRVTRRARAIGCF